MPEEETSGEFVGLPKHYLEFPLLCMPISLGDDSIETSWLDMKVRWFIPKRGTR